MRGQFTLGVSREQKSEGEGRERREDESWRSKGHSAHPAPSSHRKLSSGDQITRLPLASDSRPLPEHVPPPCLSPLTSIDVLTSPKFEGSTHHTVEQRYSDSRRNTFCGDKS